jgi:hypothetical protein
VLLLTSADVMAVAATFPSDTVTIDGNQQHNTPPTSECGFNQKGVYTGNGMTNTSSGDHWAQLTVITGGASYGKPHKPSPPRFSAMCNSWRRAALHASPCMVGCSSFIWATLAAGCPILGDFWLLDCWGHA